MRMLLLRFASCSLWQYWRTRRVIPIQALNHRNRIGGSRENGDGSFWACWTAGAKLPPSLGPCIRGDTTGMARCDAGVMQVM